jgi:hypothetical protein
MQRPHVTCDRCGMVCTEKHVTLRCLEYCIRDAKPQAQLDLCGPCYHAFRTWSKASQGYREPQVT